MRIVIAGGKNEADYIIKTFKKRGNKIIVINDDEETAKFLSRENKVDVYVGDMTKKYVYEDIDASDFDLFIALSENDTDNYVACLFAKELFSIGRCICTVINPKNVELFRSLGINYTISSTYLLSQAIKQETGLDDLVKTMTMENDRIVLSEITILDTYQIANKTIVESKFPHYGNISCIYRNPEVIIPFGSTLILPNDKLLIVSSPENQKKLIEFVKKEKDEDHE